MCFRSELPQIEGVRCGVALVSEDMMTDGQPSYGTTRDSLQAGCVSSRRVGFRPVSQLAEALTWTMLKRLAANDNRKA